MTNSNAPRMITIEDTEFMPFDKNFAGKPDDYGDSRRRAYIKIPDPRLAQELMDMGVTVKQTRPRDDEDPTDYIPVYYTRVILKYRDVKGNEMKYPPRIYLVNTDGDPIPLNEDTVANIDGMSIKNVNVVLNPWPNKSGTTSLFIRTMYVEQDFEDDPFMARYRR